MLEPFATEAEYWSVSCKPTFIRVNLFGQETFGLAKTESGEISLWMHAKHSLIKPIFQDRPELFKNIELVYRFLGREMLYESGGFDQVRLQTDAIGECEAGCLFERADFWRAVKAFNLDLMRKGRNSAKSLHCFDIVDAAMAGLYDTEKDRSQAAEPCAEELSRQGQAEFAARVQKLPSQTQIRRETIQRIGQEIFRKQLLRYWSGRCPLTGIDEPKLLRASHIKSWASCATSAERIYVYNGLLLAAHLDAAFDSGLISFSNEGRILRGDALSDANFAALGVPPSARVALTAGHRAFLAWHRQRHGFPDRL